jgi:hypothetical protein
MFDTLDSVPWGRLRHAYGSATDAPKWIRDLDSDNEENRQEAINQFLWSSAFHQYTLYTATPFVIPFVIEALASPTLAERGDGMGHPMKRELIHFLRMCADGGQRGIYGNPDPQDLTIEDAILSGRCLYERYVNDPDDRVRLDANWLRHFCDGHSNVA